MESVEMSRITSESLHQVNSCWSKDILDALYSNKIYTVVDFVINDPHKISAITRLHLKEVLEARKFLQQKYSPSVLTGPHHYKYILKNTAILPTGIKSLDDFLEGGLWTANIYQMCGIPSSGKTHFAHLLIKNTIQRGQNVYLLDTKNDFVGLNFVDTFSPSEQSLKYLLIKRTTDKFSLINSLFSIKNEFVKGLKCRLIVIDSLPAVILGISDVFERNSFLNQLANLMHYIKKEYHVIFFITNLITRFDTMQGYEENIACGKYWSRIPNTTLKISKVRADEFTLSIFDSDFIKIKDLSLSFNFGVA